MENSLVSWHVTFWLWKKIYDMLKILSKRNTLMVENMFE